MQPSFLFFSSSSSSSSLHLLSFLSFYLFLFLFSFFSLVFFFLFFSFFFFSFLSLMFPDFVLWLMKAIRVPTKHPSSSSCLPPPASSSFSQPLLLLLRRSFPFSNASPFPFFLPSPFFFLLVIMLAAVEKGDAKELAELMRQDHGFNVNVDQDEIEWTLLHYACLGDSRSAVIPLLLAHPH